MARYRRRVIVHRDGFLRQVGVGRFGSPKRKRRQPTSFGLGWLFGTRRKGYKGRKRFF